MRVWSVRLRPVALVVLSLAVAACSSTSESQRVARERSAPSAFAATQPAASDGAEGAQVPQGTGANAASPRKARASSAAARPAAGAAVPGGAARTDTIRLGYAVIDTAGFAALTGTNASQLQDSNSEQNSAAGHQEMQALVRWANKTGGVGGRKIEAFGFDIPVTSQPRERVQYCVAATEDKKVSVFIDQSIFLSEDSWACFAQHKVTYVGIVTSTDRQFLHAVRPYITTNWETLDRDVVMLVKGLDGAGYFKGAKVGVVLTDTPQVGRAYEEHMLPAFKAAGVTPADVAKLAPPISPQVGPQAANAVLRFKNSGITHVVMVAGLLEYLAFTNAAESQNYHPRYGFGDYQATAGVAAFYGSPSQNRESLAVSVSDGVVRDRDEPNDPNRDIDRGQATPGVRRCLDIYTQELGKDYYRPSQSAPSAGALYYCDHFFLWLDAARKVGAGLTPENWAQGLGALRDTYQSTLVHSTLYAPGRHDGAASYAVGKYSETNKVYVRSGPWLPLDG